MGNDPEEIVQKELTEELGDQTKQGALWPKNRRDGNRDRRSTPLPPPMVAERRLKAVRLFNAGLDYWQIADQLGISYHTAYEDVRSVARELTSRSVDELRGHQLSTMRELRKVLFPAAMGGDKGAIDRLLKVCDHEAKLFGAYAPPQGHTVTPDGRSFEDALEDMVSELTELQKRRASKTLPPALEAEVVLPPPEAYT